MSFIVHHCKLLSQAFNLLSLMATKQVLSYTEEILKCLLCCFPVKVVIQGEDSWNKVGFIRHDVRDANRHDFSTVCKCRAPLKLYT